MTREKPAQVSEIFDPNCWRDVEGFSFSDITYHRGYNWDEQTDLPWVRIAFNLPEVRNAFRPETVDELYRALDDARLNPEVGAVILTGNGPSAKDGGWAFCSGGDQRVRGRNGYMYAEARQSTGNDGNSGASNDGESGVAGGNGEHNAHSDGTQGVRANGRLHILEVQRLIRSMPKVVIAAVSGWATGGGHSLEVVCDLAIASREHARFMQVDANVASFDAGYGSQLLARQVGDRRAREIFMLARPYSADQAEAWGAINEACAHEDLEKLAIEYAATVTSKSPQAIRMLKFAFNAADDGIAGMQAFAGEATRMAYMTAEAREGRDAFLEKRKPQWREFPYYA